MMFDVSLLMFGWVAVSADDSDKVVDAGKLGRSSFLAV